jgi:hypothetical protein
MGNVKDNVASALSQISEQILPGSGKMTVRRASLYLDDIGRHLGRGFPDEFPKYAVRIYVAEVDDGGDAVSPPKKREGLFAITATSFILVHEISMARTWTKAFPNDSWRAEPITFVVKAEQMPGIRLRSSSDTIVIGLLPVTGGNAGKLASIRNGIVSVLTPPTGSRLVDDALDVSHVQHPTPAHARAALDEANARLYEGSLYESEADILADIDTTLADGVPVTDIQRYWVSLRASNKVNDHVLAIALAHLGVPGEVD